MDHGEKVIVLALLCAVFTILLLVPVYYLSSFVLFLQEEGVLGLLSTGNVVTLIILVLIVSVWVLAISKMLKSLSANMKLAKEPMKKARELKKEKDSIDLFRQVAEKEYFKRNISEETFKKIIQLCEEKEVEIKVRLKQIGAEKLIEEIKEESEKPKKGKKKARKEEEPQDSPPE